MLELSYFFTSAGNAETHVSAHKKISKIAPLTPITNGKTTQTSLTKEERGDILFFIFRVYWGRVFRMLLGTVFVKIIIIILVRRQRK